jgi:hypothetical protein
MTIDRGASVGYEVRKWFGAVEEVVHDGGAPADSPLLKAAVGVIIRNPFAGCFEEDLSPLTQPSPALGTELARRARLLVGGAEIQSYGKGGIAGVAGEQEHVVACITTPFGDALREGVGGGAAWISSATKVGSAGEPLDLPLAYKDALYVRSHYDAMTIRISDSPRPDELLIAIAVATGGRLHHRVGGLAAADAIGDGVR